MLDIKKIEKGLLLIQMIVMGLSFPAFAQQEQQKEYVQVVNVEMILRVLKDGSPVSGLKKNDFALYEDGEKCEINGFFENHRRSLTPTNQPNSCQQPRLYLLFFWVNNPAADVEGVLNKFFSSIYREGDRVILSTPLKTFELPSPQATASITAAFLEQWRQEAKNKLSNVRQFQVDMNRLLEDLVRRLVEDMAKNAVKEKTTKALGLENSLPKEKDTAKAKEIDAFLAQYASTVQEYRLRELSPDMTTFEAMARSMLPNKKR